MSAVARTPPSPDRRADAEAIDCTAGTDRGGGQASTLLAAIFGSASQQATKEAKEARVWSAKIYATASRGLPAMVSFSSFVLFYLFCLFFCFFLRPMFKSRLTDRQIRCRWLVYVWCLELMK